MDAVVRYTVGQAGNEQVRSVNALVGETNDGGLNDIRGFHITRQHVLEAIANAKAGPVEEGSVGAGTGTRLHGWKEESARHHVLPGGYTVGVLAQTNFVGISPSRACRSSVCFNRLRAPPDSPSAGFALGVGDGSCMLVVATDAPLDARPRRLAARAVFGLGRTGSSFSNGSVVTLQLPSPRHLKCGAVSAKPHSSATGAAP
jgi:D-aminopeptidase